MYLFAVVCDRGQDGSESLETDGNIQQVSRKEEVVEVAKQGEAEVPHNVQERLE